MQIDEQQSEGEAVLQAQAGNAQAGPSGKERVAGEERAVAGMGALSLGP
jgi:hypothetical protein